MDEGEAQIHTSSPGARLAAAREQAGMTLPQAAEHLRLDVGTLQALEAGRFQTLGAAVFVRGHLRHYAELVGLPADEIDAAYAASSARLAPQPDLRLTTTLLTTTLPGNAAPRGISLPPRAALIGAIVLVLMALVWWAMRVVPGQRQGANPAGSSPVAVLPGEAPGTPSAAANSPRAAEASAPRTDAAASPKPLAPMSKEGSAKDGGARDAASAFRDVVLGTRAQAAPAADTRAPSVPATAPPVAPKPTATTPAAIAPPVALKPASATAAASAPTVVLKPASSRVRLTIRFNQDSWTEIYDARGATLFHDFGSAGSARRVSGTAPLRVLLGNPDGVSVELDGHPVALKPAAQSGRPQRFSLDSNGRLGDVPTSQTPTAAPAAAAPAAAAPAAAAPAAATTDTTLPAAIPPPAPR
jgi:cytoskeleton protein RodZ